MNISDSLPSFLSLLVLVTVVLMAPEFAQAGWSPLPTKPDKKTNQEKTKENVSTLSQDVTTLPPSFH
ncbi:MAG: hypothetical protein DRP71_14920 [Verrucomicrobia bacterium]|nr:MAG: hypothetical protein DRP71_14920 [Verrucomicrobiota bacterium]